MPNKRIRERVTSVTLALMPDISAIVWKGVPLELASQWRLVFSERPARIRVQSPCPVCGQRLLFRWHDGGRSLWEWCQSCFCYEHSSAFPPADWTPELVLQPVGVTAEHSAIVTALRAAGIIY